MKLVISGAPRTKKTSVTPAGLFIPGPLPGMNELIDAAKGAGGRGARYARLKRDWTAAIAGLAQRASLPTYRRPVVFKFMWVEKDRRRDPDNVAAGGRKLVLDGLVAAGVLTGDGWRFVQSWYDTFRVDPYRPGVGVELYEMDATVGMAA